MTKSLIVAAVACVATVVATAGIAFGLGTANAAPKPPTPPVDTQRYLDRDHGQHPALDAANRNQLIGLVNSGLLGHPDFGLGQDKFPSLIGRNSVIGRVPFTPFH